MWLDLLGVNLHALALRWRGADERPELWRVPIAALVSRLGRRRCSRLDVGSLSREWLEQHEIDAAKHQDTL